MSIDFWIVLTAALIAMACAIPGVFLVLCRQSMFGHGVAHAVLPGLVVAFLITQSRDLPAVILGATVAAMMTGVFTRLVHQSGEVEEGASLCVVFTSLFALGLVLIRLVVDTVHLDADCVLFGMIEMSVVDGILDDTIPSVTVRSAGILVANLLLVLIFFKELRLSTFDAGLASALGFRPQLMHHGIMIVTAITAVLAFESVGSILVIAMMVGPAATAYLVTSRLTTMIGLAMFIGALTALSGHLFSLYVPAWLFYHIRDDDLVGSTNTAGGISVAVGLVFIAVLLFKLFAQHFTSRNLTGDQNTA